MNRHKFLEESTFEINETKYDCSVNKESGNYIVTIWGKVTHNRRRVTHIDVHGMKFCFGFDDNTLIKDVEMDLETIYKEDIIYRGEECFFRFKSLTPNFYTSPTYSTEIKPAKRE